MPGFERGRKAQRYEQGVSRLRMESRGQRGGNRLPELRCQTGIHQIRAIYGANQNYQGDETE